MADPKPIKQRIETEYKGDGVEQAQRDTQQFSDTVDESANSARKQKDAADDAGRSVRDMGDHVQEGGRKQDRHTGFINDSTNALAQYASQLGGAAGLIMLMEQFAHQIEAVNARLKENAELVKNSAQATLDMQALGQGYSREDDAFIDEMRALSGRGVEDLAPAFTAFKSQTANLTPEEQRNLFRENVVMPGLTTSGDLASMATFSARMSGRFQPLESRNLLRLGIQQAGEADPAVFARYASELIPNLVSAGVSAEDAVALYSYQARQFESAPAATALRQILNRMVNDENVVELLQKTGIDTSTDVFDQLQQISRFDVPGSVLTQISGTEYIGQFQNLLEGMRSGQFNQTRENIAPYSSGRDFYAEDIAALMEQSAKHRETLRANQEHQKLLIEKENETEGLTRGSARDAYERRLEGMVRRGEISALQKENMLQGSYVPLVGRVGGYDTYASMFNQETAEMLANYQPSSIASDLSFGRVASMVNPITAGLYTYFNAHDMSNAGSEALNRPVFNVNQFINNGTTINQGKDPRTADLADPAAEP